MQHGNTWFLTKLRNALCKYICQEKTTRIEALVVVWPETGFPYRASTILRSPDVPYQVISTRKR